MVNCLRSILSCVEFCSSHPTPTTAWRLAVLMGANSRTNYELRGRGAQTERWYSVRRCSGLSKATTVLLDGELEARWRIVESSFATGVGRSLITEEVTVDLGSGTVIDKLRRRSLAGVREAVGGFQVNRCQICDELLVPDAAIAIDHVFPFSLMSRGVPLGWADLDLDSIWNLAPAHASCNGAKSTARAGH